MGPLTTPGPGWRRLRAMSEQPDAGEGQGFLCIPPVPLSRFCLPGGVQKRGLRRLAFV